MLLYLGMRKSGLPARTGGTGRGLGGVWAPNSFQKGLLVIMFVVREEREPRMLWGLHYARAGNKHFFHFISLHFTSFHFAALLGDVVTGRLLRYFT